MTRNYKYIEHYTSVVSQATHVGTSAAEGVQVVVKLKACTQCCSSRCTRSGEVEGVYTVLQLKVCTRSGEQPTTVSNTKCSRKVDVDVCREQLRV